MDQVRFQQKAAELQMDLRSGQANRAAAILQLEYDHCPEEGLALVRSSLRQDTSNLLHLLIESDGSVTVRDRSGYGTYATKMPELLQPAAPVQAPPDVHAPVVAYQTPPRGSQAFVPPPPESPWPPAGPSLEPPDQYPAYSYYGGTAPPLVAQESFSQGVRNILGGVGEFAGAVLGGVGALAGGILMGAGGVSFAVGGPPYWAQRREFYGPHRQFLYPRRFVSYNYPGSYQQFTSPYPAWTTSGPQVMPQDGSPYPPPGEEQDY